MTTEAGGSAPEGDSPAPAIRRDDPAVSGADAAGRGTDDEDRQVVAVRREASAARDAAAEATEAARSAESSRESQAAQASQQSGSTGEQFGRLGRPIRRDSPFVLGFLGALGVFVAYFLIQALVHARSVIILIVVSLFLAIGLNPVVAGLTGRGMRRGVAIAVVFFGVIGAFVGFGFAILPPAAEQTNDFVQQLPKYLDDLRENPTVSRIDRDWGLIDRARDYVTSGDLGKQLFGGLLGVGRIVLSAVFSALTVLILTLYFLAALPSMKRQAYRLVPSTRRERVQLLGDEILVRIGGFVSGALVVALLAGVTSYAFLLLVGLPFALALAVFVALLDLIPLIGATISAVVVTLVGFTESPTVGLICVAFYLAYQQFENYVVYPRVMRRAVDVPAPVTVVAVLLGGALLGVVGALLAIPAAAALLLVVRQVAIPRMDRV